MAPWPSGKAKVCNTSIPGPIPGGASKKIGTHKGAYLFGGYSLIEPDRATSRTGSGSQFQILICSAICLHELGDCFASLFHFSILRQQMTDMSQSRKEATALRVAAPARRERAQRFFSIAFLCAYTCKEKRLKSLGI